MRFESLKDTEFNETVIVFWKIIVLLKSYRCEKVDFVYWFCT